MKINYSLHLYKMQLARTVFCEAGLKCILYVISELLLLSLKKWLNCTAKFTDKHLWHFY